MQYTQIYFYTHIKRNRRKRMYSIKIMMYNMRTAKRTNGNIYGNIIALQLRRNLVWLASEAKYVLVRCSNWLMGCTKENTSIY